MDEMKENGMPPLDTPGSGQEPWFVARRGEWIFCAVCVICGLCLANFVLYGGFNLGFALAGLVLTVTTTLYLMTRGYKLTAYPAALLGLSLVILAGFGRSDDGFVKFVMLCFLTLAENLSLCLLVGKNRRDPGRFSAMWDAPMVIFSMGLEKMQLSLQSLRISMKRSGKLGRVSGGLMAGLLISVPLLIVVVLLLMRADAAFSGLIAQLPELDFGAVIGTAAFGAMAFCWIFTRGVALHYSVIPPVVKQQRKGVYPLTVNTVLVALCLVYVLYLVSQLAYFTGGLSGILPEEFTMAEYARRGFFEMAVLSGINLCTVAIAVAVVAKKEKTPLFTRLLCLFISLITLFFVVSASAKMGLYIGSYALSRLRLLTEVIMVFLAITTILVAVWLFVPKMPYMKAVILVALVMGAVVLWVDVDAVVAAYNVSAYQNGLIHWVDVDYLTTLSDGAVPYIEKLVNDANPQVAQQASSFINMSRIFVDDFRDWNYATWIASMIAGGR